uniref:14-3-3 domain-containing protein n=1 Tax=Ditylenchus dipsaci TaxID=166011 RepID=A0A915D8M8_9BILA
MKDICNDVLKTMDKIVPHAVDDDAKVFFLKMKADYLRYLLKCRGSRAPKESSSYSEAFDIAKEKIRPPIFRLGLALNFSVFSIDCSRQGEGLRARQEAFDEALAGLNGVDEESHKDTL